MRNGLVVGDFDETVVEWLIDPFRFFERRIKQRLKLKLVFEHTLTLHEVDSALKKHRPDILFFTIDWAVPVADVVSYLKGLFEHPDRPHIVYLDHYCLSSTPFFAAMPYVDLYVRKQLLTPVSDYNDKVFRGKNIIADFISRHYDIPLGDFEFGSIIPEGCENKLIPGWNLGTADTLSRPARYPILRKFSKRTKKKLDLTCRVSLTEDEGDTTSIYYIHRVNCMDAVVKLENKIKIGHNANGEQISYKAFQRELRESRMALSPFGWGEITDRDFRIINARTLLLKPDMSHLETYPDVFRAGETYAPVKWDFSDLEEVCEYYLSHPAETREIAENAINVYDDYYRQAKFIDKIEEILQRLDDI